MNTGIAEMLQDLPDLEPPADGWQRVDRRVRAGRLRRRSRHVLAASFCAVAAGVLFSGFIAQDQTAPVSPSAPAFQSLIVAAPTNTNVQPAENPALLDLQARSRSMERYLSSLSRDFRVTSADQAGVIAELEDRIAAVDYQLNLAVWASSGQADSRPSSGSVSPASPPELWRQRVEYMDQLVRAHFVDTDVTGF